MLFVLCVDLLAWRHMRSYSRTRDQSCTPLHWKGILTTGLPEKSPVCLLTFLLDHKHCEFCIIDLDFLFFFFFSSFVLFLAVLLSFQGLISLTRDWTWALGSRSTELQPLDCPGGPLHLVFLTLMRGTPFSFTITISQFKQIALSWTSNLFILDGDLLASSLCSAIHGNHCVCGGLSPRIIPPTSLTQPGLFSFYLPLAASIHQLSWQQSQLIRHFGDALANLGWNLSGPVLGWLNQDHLLSLSLIPGKWWNVNYSSHRKPMPPSHSHHLRTLSPFVSSEYSRYDILKEKS